MKILLVGATGTIGSAVARALEPRHNVVGVSRHSTPSVDITDRGAIAKLFDTVAGIDAVVCCAGGGAWKPLAQLTDEDFENALHDKLMGQVNVIRTALHRVSDGGSVTVTSGVLGRQPMQDGAALSLVNGGLEAFVRAAALEAPRGIRVNVVSPPWVSETLSKLGMDPSGGLAADVVARAYVAAVEGSQTGATIEPSR